MRHMLHYVLGSPPPMWGARLTPILLLVGSPLSYFASLASAHSPKVVRGIKGSERVMEVRRSEQGATE